MTIRNVSGGTHLNGEHLPSYFVKHACYFSLILFEPCNFLYLFSITFVLRIVVKIYTMGDCIVFPCSNLIKQQHRDNLKTSLLQWKKGAFIITYVFFFRIKFSLHIVVILHNGLMNGYRGYYMVVRRRYELYFRVCQYLSRVSEANE